MIQDLEKIDVKIELIEIENISEEKFKQICKEKIRKLSFSYLIAKKNNRNSINPVQYTHLEMVQYLQEDVFRYTIKEKQNLFK